MWAGALYQMCRLVTQSDELEGRDTGRAVVDVVGCDPLVVGFDMTCHGGRILVSTRHCPQQRSKWASLYPVEYSDGVFRGGQRPQGSVSADVRPVGLSLVPVCWSCCRQVSTG